MNKQKFLEELFCQMAEQRRKAEPSANTVGAVAASHDTPLHPSLVPPGVTPESPCWRLHGGQNGKRPLYAVLDANEGWHPARGWFFGGNSSFKFIPLEEILTMPDVLSPAERSEYNFLTD